MAVLRRNQWVVYKPENRTGIYVGNTKKGELIVDLVDSRGDTLFSVVAAPSEVRGAHRREIPAARIRRTPKAFLDRFYPER